MDSIKGRLMRLDKGKIATASLISLVASAVLAAAVFLVQRQPYGFVAPPALSTSNFSTGNGVAYTPWFESGTFRGDLLAFPIASNGLVAVLAPLWRASDQVDAQDPDTGRRIVTTDGAGNGIPFRFANLTLAQQLQVGDDRLVNFVRGSHADENASQYRTRVSVLGTIIHSGPVYVGKPKSGYIFDNYLAFADSNSGRQPQVYVGANDGMLHAFNGTTGTEEFAYVPSMVMGNLPMLGAQPFVHNYFVDGFLTAEDAQFGAGWRTVLVGGLGAGGKGYYALDVTSPAAGTEFVAAGKILWEFHSGVAGAANLGFSYSRPSIVRLNSGVWVAVVGNGYLSASGVASLYLLDIQTGTVVREIVVPDMNANGMSSPTVIDADTDGHADTAYAGDLNGNLWKFDLNAGTVAFGGQPLFQTALSGGVRQAITAAPEVGVHPEDGVMVYVGTGRLLGTADITDTSTQAVYGIWDDGSGPATLAELRMQQLKPNAHPTGGAVRTATDFDPNWAVHRGWATPTEIVGASSLDMGERVIQDMLLRDGRITFMTVNPTIPSGENWLMQLDAETGGAPNKIIFDTDGNDVLSLADNVDGNGDAVINEVADDRVVGQYQNFGLASRPILGTIGVSKDSALINHLAAIAPAAPWVGNPDDPGLLGGHFDLDTSSQVYGFSVGDTDGHVHEWDDKHDRTTIDFFDLPDGDGEPLYEISASSESVENSDVFMLTVANTELSPGGVLEINGTSVSVSEYKTLVERYLDGTLPAGLTFPMYKLDPPTVVEQAAGVERLTSLKLSFDAFAIISGDLIPTEPVCVRDNDAGPNGEYRNGALIIQALNASDIGGGFVLDVATNRYVAGSTAIHATHGYATENLYWEASIFWHWDDGCYHDEDWEPAYVACIINGLGDCVDDVRDDPDAPPPPGVPPPPPGVPPPPPIEPVETDSDHSISSSTISGADDLGRLFWKELIPEE